MTYYQILQLSKQTIKNRSLTRAASCGPTLVTLSGNKIQLRVVDRVHVKMHVESQWWCRAAHTWRVNHSRWSGCVAQRATEIRLHFLQSFDSHYLSVEGQSNFRDGLHRNKGLVGEPALTIKRLCFCSIACEKRFFYYLNVCQRSSTRFIGNAARLFDGAHVTSPLSVWLRRKLRFRPSPFHIHHSRAGASLIPLDSTRLNRSLSNWDVFNCTKSAVK